ncbi:MAG TPA: hypothetical protein DCS08_03755 [Candidatus Moranbacteria bacterium]|nr:hypothetical protein [Candidatus Moranbacteria bacterium]HBY10695.1 hypothetical protein [Candidatus Moranbacteria bacterium]
MARSGTLILKLIKISSKKMEQKNKKNIRASLIVIISVLAFVLVVMLVYKNKKSIPQVINQKIEKLQNKEENKISEENVNEVEAKDIKFITGKIISIDISSVKIKTSDGELTLSIPEQNVSFLQKTTQKNGDLLMKEIGLFDVVKNKDVEIQYNSAKNEVMLIVVK